MLQKLDKDKYNTVAVVSELFQFPIISAVIEGRQQGVIYVDTVVDPQLVLVFHKVGFSYLYTRTGIDYNRLLNFIQNEADLPKYFHVYDAPEAFIHCVSHHEAFNIKVRRRIQLRYHKRTIEVKKYSPAVPVKAKRINNKNFGGLEIFGLQLGNKFWSSEEIFLNESYGVVLSTEEEQPLAICYAASISNNLAEVDIMTKPEYHGLGLAKYAAALFVEAGLGKGIVTNWDCFEENTGSLKTAKAIGFEMIKEYTFLSLYIK